MSDFTQRFLFEDNDVRGEMVELDRSYAEVLAKHDYPEPVARLLGELLAAAALLGSTLKFDGLLVLQARSSGPLPLLMVECSSDREIRGIARYESDIGADAGGLRELMPEGVLTLTVDPKVGKRYQGIVSLDGDSLSACLSSYFALSQQLPSRFWLRADAGHARGLLLQQMPADRLPDAEARAASWEHVVTLADTLSDEELLGLDNQTILHRLYHQEEVRLFDAQPLQFACSCSRERSARALVSLGEVDARALLEEQGGEVTIDCQFCNARYQFDAADVIQLFAGGGTAEPSPTRH
ncbi:Hsp33 family molecular chaperone HslO [Geopseudomonas guangdongensis]|uniref:33 kDa chaperonin n=1 Tax=Geopseudomonas guangdongensis TaxID=1245526 RepID=A0A1H2EFI0_9GAMM|nr:Hsp33 family molecular chaperone HslO [Pseudomonas guangdongensis]SDT93759.1 molecular chaperone Hsp33 [Pseudomonas guangdongensis]